MRITSVFEKDCGTTGLNDGIVIPLERGDRLYYDMNDKNSMSIHLWVSDDMDVDNECVVEAVGPDYIIIREASYGWPRMIVFDKRPEAHLKEFGATSQQDLVNKLCAHWKDKKLPSMSDLVDRDYSIFGMVMKEEKHHIPNFPPCLGCSDIDCKDCSASPWDEAFENRKKE
jgi:hypothetical protein